jgi:[CysO sulfur-carrier protein]-S-L-cysteine hydrolase
MAVVIKQATWEALQAHAVAAYPDECCGMVVDRNGNEETVPVTNIQNDLHAQDPGQFPRTAQTAYTMGPEAAPILIATERGELRLRVIYHSHPDHDAYFSAEDRTQALGGWDEPNYPDAAQIVISVRNRVVQAAKAFAWNASQRDFVEVPLTVR